MGVAFKENTFHMMTTGIIKQCLAKLATDAFSLCIWRDRHLCQLVTVRFRMRFQRTATHDLSAFVYSQKYLPTMSDDVVIDMCKCVKIRLLQSEIGFYPLFVQSDKVLFVAWLVCSDSYHSIHQITYSTVSSVSR